MAADNEPAEPSLRANTLKTTARELAERLPAARRRRRGADPRRARSTPSRRPSGSDGLLMPQSRAAMAVSRALAPAARRARAGPVRRARRQDHPPGRADGQRGRDRRRREAPRPRRRAAQDRRADGGDDRRRAHRATPPSRASDGVRPRARRPALQRPRHARLAARRALAQGRAARRRWPRCSAEILEAGASALRPGGTLVYSTCTISPTENEQRRGSLPGRSRGFLRDDLGADLPALEASDHAAAPADAPAPRPHRRLLRREASTARMSDAETWATSARPATSRGCAPRTCPAAIAA